MQLKFRNKWLTAAAVQLICVIIDGKYVNFYCKLLCNKQFSIQKIPGFGLRQSRDSGVENGRLQCQPATIFLYWHKHKTDQTYLLYYRRSNVRKLYAIGYNSYTYYIVHLQVVDVGLQNRLKSILVCWYMACVKNTAPLRCFDAMTYSKSYAAVCWMTSWQE